MIKIATIIGARPQFIKAAAVSRIIRDNDLLSEVLIHTGQHYDKNMSKIFFNELDIPEPDYNLSVGSMSHGKQTGLMLEKIEDVLLNEKPDIVITYGDTNSTIAGALSAVKLHIPTAHIEAGLRSFNREMPEEINRVAVDHISDLLFTPTKNATFLLKKEGVVNNVIFSGDVMYDSVIFYYGRINKDFTISDISLPEKYYLATIHRPENTDNLQRLQNIFSAFSELDYPVIIPLHPRTKQIINNISYNNNVKLVNPVGYLEMLFLLNNSVKVLTDSGGLQKEAYFLRKPCITLRDQTEWIETLAGNWNFIVGADKEKILKYISVADFDKTKNAFGDGKAADKIVNEIINYLKKK